MGRVEGKEGEERVSGDGLIYVNECMCAAGGGWDNFSGRD